MTEGTKVALALRVWSSKFQTSDLFLVVIFELSGVDYPHKHSLRTSFAIFEKSEKYYVCVLNFVKKMVFVETYLLRGDCTYAQTTAGKL